MAPSNAHRAPAERRNRRLVDAVNTLIDLREEYREWSERLADTPKAGRLDKVIDALDERDLVGVASLDLPPMDNLALSIAERHARVERPPMAIALRGTGVAAQRRFRRFMDGVDTLINLREEYREWREALPLPPTAERLDDVIEALDALDLEGLASLDMPRG